MATAWLLAGLSAPVSAVDIPVSFVENAGQLAANVSFYASQAGADVYVTDRNVLVYAVSGAGEAGFPAVFRESPVNGRLTVPRARNMRPARFSYFRGDDKNAWIAVAKTWGGVGLGEIWPGVEVNLIAGSRGVEKVFTIAPGTDPEVVRLRIDGAGLLSVDDSGELRMELKNSPASFTAPEAYQIIDGRRVTVDVRYVTDGTEYGFAPGAYRRDCELIIDPLLGSTYLGGTAADNKPAVVVDDDGFVYVAGMTSSTSFPSTDGAYLQANPPGDDIFIVKFNADLSELIAGTFLGGGGNDGGGRNLAMMLDGQGNLYLAGQTRSADFPHITGSYDTAYAGNEDVFIARLTTDLSSLTAVTFLGTTGYEEANSIVRAGNGDIVVAGYTNSSLFPTTVGAYDNSYNGTGTMPWGGDIFVSRFSADLTTLEASTYLGGSDWEDGGYLAVNDDDDIFVTGSTNLGFAKFPTTAGAYSETYFGDEKYGDVFVSRLSGDLTTLEASTYFGGSGDDWVYGLRLDADGNLYFTGHTSSTDLPTSTGAFREDYAGSGGSDVGNDGLICRMGPDLDTVLACTYLGSPGWEYTKTLTLGDDGVVYVIGNTNSTTFPIMPGACVDEFGGGAYQWGGETYFATLDAGLTELLTSSFLGGVGIDGAGGLALNAAGDLYITGATQSSDFPTTEGAYDRSRAGGDDVFVSCVPRAHFVDTDGDSVEDAGDNCPEIGNAD